MIVAHLDPDEVPQELDALVDVYDWAVDYFNMEVHAPEIFC